MEFSDGFSYCRAFFLVLVGLCVALALAWAAGFAA
jgi:hypothetical protein